MNTMGFGGLEEFWRGLTIKLFLHLKKFITTIVKIVSYLEFSITSSGPTVEQNYDGAGLKVPE
jgi:hypothetical protein